MAKFKVGDKARVVKTRTSIHSCWKEGVEVVIGEVCLGSICTNGTAYDYVVIHNEGEAIVLEDQLRPILDLGSWDEIEDSIGWNPTKTTDKKEANYSSSSSATA